VVAKAAEEARAEKAEEEEAEVVSALIATELGTLAGNAESRKDEMPVAADCAKTAVGSEDGLDFNLEVNESGLETFSEGFEWDAVEIAAAVDGTWEEKTGTAWSPTSMIALAATCDAATLAASTTAGANAGGGSGMDWSDSAGMGATFAASEDEGCNSETEQGATVAVSKSRA
jgi:hypothetical protein